MKIQAVLEFNDSTLEHLWRSYDLFDQEQAVVGRLYLRADHLPQKETINLERQEIEEDE